MALGRHHLLLHRHVLLVVLLRQSRQLYLLGLQLLMRVVLRRLLLMLHLMLQLLCVRVALRLSLARHHPHDARVRPVLRSCVVVRRTADP